MYTFTVHDQVEHCCCYAIALNTRNFHSRMHHRSFFFSSSFCYWICMWNNGMHQKAGQWQTHNGAVHADCPAPASACMSPDPVEVCTGWTPPIRYLSVDTAVFFYLPMLPFPSFRPRSPAFRSLFGVEWRAWTSSPWTRGQSPEGDLRSSGRS